MEEEGGGSSRPSSFLEESLESRDNPFLPGGDLSREAEDLLSKSTIVRDKFYLHQQQHQGTTPFPASADPNSTLSQPPTGGGATAKPSRDAADGAVPNDKHPPSSAVEERITPTSSSATNAEARPPSGPHPRENGKASSDGVSSPDGVKVEVGPEGSKGPVVSDCEGEEKDKGKRRAKCCVLM